MRDENQGVEPGPLGDLALLLKFSLMVIPHFSPSSKDSRQPTLQAGCHTVSQCKQRSWPRRRSPS